MFDAMSIAASGMQNYAAQFTASVARLVSGGGAGMTPENFVGMTEAKIGFEASAKAFTSASKLYGSLVDILV